jgi:AcrR family transcriptional regulator
MPHAFTIATMRTEPAEVSEHRHRLLEGMSHAVAAKGYADTTIADIVREAAVSRRTFYEHFQTKADCLAALYEAASHNALQVLRAAIDPQREWQAQVEQAMTAYLGCLAQNPVLLRTLFMEILALGEPGLAARRRANLEIAQFMRGVINAGLSSEVLSQDMATAIVGGIHELVLQAIEQGQGGQLQLLVEPASRLVRAVAHAPLASELPQARPRAARLGRAARR